MQLFPQEQARPCRMTLRVRALSLVANHLGLETREALRAGLRHVGVTGGEHVVRSTKTGRFFRACLVLEEVALCVGLAPTVEPW